MKTRRHGSLVVFAAALVFLAPDAGSAQNRTTSQLDAIVVPAAIATAAFTQPQSPQEPEMDANGRMTTSGFFLGIVGMLGGAAVGSGVGNARCGSDCVGRHAANGASIMGALTVPIGVHVAAEKPKNLIKSMGLSVLGGAVVWMGFNSLPGKPVALAPFVAAPLQVWTAMKMETR